jgi:tetratricopeptide (TPR) repeat protein
LNTYCFLYAQKEDSTSISSRKHIRKLTVEQNLSVKEGASERTVTLSGFDEVLPSGAMSSSDSVQNVEASLSDVALEQFTQALDHAIPGGISTASPSFLAKILEQIALTNEREGNIQHAKAVYMYALRVLNKETVDDKLVRFSIENRLAHLAIIQGQLSTATEYYQNILERYQSFIPEQHPLFIEALYHLSHSYVEQQKYHQAYLYLKWAEEMIQQNHFSAGIFEHAVYNDLGEVLLYRGLTGEAVGYFEKAHAAFLVSFGEESLPEDNAVMKAAALHLLQGNMESASRYVAEASSIFLCRAKYILPTLEGVKKSDYAAQLGQAYETLMSIMATLSQSDPTQAVRMGEVHFYEKKYIEPVNRAYRDDVVKDSSTYNLWRHACKALSYRYQLPVHELGERNISIDVLEARADSLRSCFDPLSTTSWEAISQPAEGNAYVEIIRYHPPRLLVTRGDHIHMLQHYELGSSDSVSYAALIRPDAFIFNTSVYHWDNGILSETQFLKSYKAQRINELDSLGHLMIQEPFETLLQNKNVYLYGEGVFELININNSLRMSMNNRTPPNVYHLLDFPRVTSPLNLTKAESNAVLFRGEMNSAGREAAPGAYTNFEKLWQFYGVPVHVFLRQAASKRNLKQLHSPSLLEVHIYKVVLDSLNHDIRMHLKLPGRQQEDEYIMTSKELSSLTLQGTTVLMMLQQHAIEELTPQAFSIFKEAWINAGVYNLLLNVKEVDEDDSFIRELYNQIALGVDVKNAYMQLMHSSENAFSWQMFTRK